MLLVDEWRLRASWRATLAENPRCRAERSQYESQLVEERGGSDESGGNAAAAGDRAERAEALEPPPTTPADQETKASAARTEPRESSPDRQNPWNEDKRWESVRLKMIPRLEHGVGARNLRIHHRGEVYLKPMVERSGKEIHRYWPQTKELLTHLAQRPLRAKDLRAPAECVGEDIQFPRDKLGQQADGIGLAKAKNLLGH